MLGAMRMQRPACTSRGHPRARLLRSFCRKLVGSTVLSYLAWLAMAPSLYINIADNENGPW